MGRTHLDFSSSELSEDERFGSLMALSRGMLRAMQSVLGQVSAYNDLLEEEFEAQPAAVRYIAISQVTVRRALGWLNVLNETLDWDRPFERIDLSLLVEGAVHRCSKIAPADTSLSCQLPERGLVVPGDLFQLQGLVMKVLTGFAARHAGSHIRVGLDLVEMDADDLRLVGSRCQPGSYAMLTASTGGIHVRKDRLVEFWDVLCRDYGRDADDEVALLQAYGVVLEHDGDIFFHPPEDGAAMALILHAAGADARMQAVTNFGETELRGDETILLVDDEDMIWDVIIDMLQELGYSVILAGNGVEAVEIYRDNPGEIDLVLLDMVMPEMNGREAFRELRDIDPAVRVLLSSGYMSEDDARDVLEAGAAGFLRKPYRMVDLARTIREVFGGAR